MSLSGVFHQLQELSAGCITVVSALDNEADPDRCKIIMATRLDYCK